MSQPLYSTSHNAKQQEHAEFEVRRPDSLIIEFDNEASLGDVIHVINMVKALPCVYKYSCGHRGRVYRPRREGAPHVDDGHSE